jgi:MOSC domain-containing protein
MSQDRRLLNDGDRPHGDSVGRVVALWRYPVKSMAAESLEEVDVSWHGLAGDRRWAFVRGGMERSGFPWLTIREQPDMGHYRPRFEEPGKPDKSPTRVRTPSGGDFEVVDPALAAELGNDARVIKQSRGVFDTFPLSLITTQTVASLGRTVGAELGVQRFRPNLLIEATSRSAFPEDAWVGSLLRIGEATMRVDKRDQRCAVVNVDPATAQRDPATLRAIAETRESCLGVYGSTVQPGRIALGDPVYLGG